MLTLLAMMTSNTVCPIVSSKNTSVTLSTMSESDKGGIGWPSPVVLSIAFSTLAPRDVRASLKLPKAAAEGKPVPARVLGQLEAESSSTSVT